MTLFRHRMALVRAGAACLALAWAAACGGSETPPRRDTPPAHVAKAVIVIHGVGNQNVGYSQPFQDGLRATAKDLHFIEVLWSDLGSMLRQAPALPNSERDTAEKELLAEIDAAEKRAMAERTAAQDDVQLRNEYAAARGFVGPIVQYEFLSVAERGRIQQRLRDALDWAALNADHTYVVAHSLGSVIAFDVLHSWEAGKPPANVALLSTMGSPLIKRIFLGHRGRPVMRPANVAAWVNFHSRTDPIASPLAGGYGDVTDQDVHTSILPITAHTAYWTHQDVLTSLLARLR
jgi:hypothetical protein